MRDIRDVAVGTLSTRITSQLQSLQGLHLRLRDICNYLQKVVDGSLPINHVILANLQDVFNLLPNLSSPTATADAQAPNAQKDSLNPELSRAMSVKSNDQLMTIYLSSLIRAITAFHDLIDNKIQNRQQEEDQQQKEKGKSENDKSATNSKEQTNGVSKETSAESDQDKKKS